MTHILFHVPWAVDPKSSAATSIRPRRMLEAFRAIGYDVDVIMGPASERATLVDAVKRKIQQGRRYRFLYSESSTLPTPLASGKAEFLRHPTVDWAFFKLCHQYGVPAGLFYRDIYWRFPKSFTGQPFLKRSVFHAVYRVDLRMYERYIHTLFLPSLRMRPYLPKMQGVRFDELPSGLDFDAAAPAPGHVERPSNAPLRLVYIGGLGTHYRLHALARAASELPSEVELLICCREAEWRMVASEYEPLPQNVSVVHAQGAEADRLLSTCDVASLVMEPSEYRGFAMPMKLFTYMAARCPIIATEGTAAGDFVQANELGWTLPYDQAALVGLLRRLRASAEALADARSASDRHIPHHTWEARARHVEARLVSSSPA